MKKIARIALYVVLAVAVLFGGAVAFLSLRAPAMRAASDEKIERTPERLARGKYLVEHVSGCIGCHSDRQFDRYGMPVKTGTELQGGTPFDERGGVPGVVCAQNLTPDPETGIGGWTDGEVMRAFREGVTRDGQALFPMMPYTYYRVMSDDDARAVVAYLRTFPPIRNVIPKSRIAFPVNLFIKAVPQPLPGVVATPNPSDRRAYGEYMVTIAGCKECHTPHDGKGRPLPDMDYAGGWEMRGPWGRVVTPNITPDPETSWMGRATKEQFVARFKSFAGLDGDKAPKVAPGKNTVMPWLEYAGMTEDDLGVIYDHLQTRRPVKHRTEALAAAP